MRGIYSTDQCSEGADTVNHSGLIVGWGKSPKRNIEYWVVKNHWGTEWGEQGFFRIQKGVNMCGIAQCASFADEVTPLA